MSKLNSRMIWVTFQRAGIHHYPGAPEDVSYLRYPHRHIFKFKVSIDVLHENREIEFHQFLNWLESLFTKGTLTLDYQSCEMISDNLYEKIQNEYPGRKVIIEISEDGECGSVSEYIPE